MSGTPLAAHVFAMTDAIYKQDDRFFRTSGCARSILKAALPLTTNFPRSATARATEMYETRPARDGVKSGRAVVDPMADAGRVG